MKCRQEIGSEFHIENIGCTKTAENNLFTYLKKFNSSYFDSGRSALRCLLQQIKHKKVLLPGYICESVRLCFGSECSVVYYNVNSDFKIDWNDLLEKIKCDVDVVYIHYFNGYIGEEYDFNALLELKKKYGFVIIEDTTHSLLSEVNTVGDFCVASLRKWFPVPDGGVLYSKQALKSQSLQNSSWSMIKKDAMEKKREYLQGDSDDKQSFLKVFSYTESVLDRQAEPFSISSYSYNALKTIDCNVVANTRKCNYELLKNIINCKPIADGGINQIPLFYMISVSHNRNGLRTFLSDSGIYCPVHWPIYGELKSVPNAVLNNETELSIPIDQRYDSNDMLHIAKVYRNYFFQRESK